MGHVKQYEVQFIIKTSGTRQTQTVTAHNSQDARKLIEAQYGDGLKMVVSVKELN